MIHRVELKITKGGYKPPFVLLAPVFDRLLSGQLCLLSAVPLFVPVSLLFDSSSSRAGFARMISISKCPPLVFTGAEFNHSGDISIWEKGDITTWR